MVRRGKGLNRAGAGVKSLRCDLRHAKVFVWNYLHCQTCLLLWSYQPIRRNHEPPHRPRPWGSCLRIRHHRRWHVHPRRWLWHVPLRAGLGRRVRSLRRMLQRSHGLHGNVICWPTGNLRLLGCSGVGFLAHSTLRVRSWPHQDLCQGLRMCFTSHLRLAFWVFDCQWCVVGWCYQLREVRNVHYSRPRNHLRLWFLCLVLPYV